MTIVGTAYTTEARLQRRMSAAAVIDYSDHDNDGTGDINVVDDAINESTDWINYWVTQGGYTTTNISASSIIAGWATDIAVCYLCQMRGNPPPVTFLDRCEKIDERLKAIAEGREVLPGIAMSNDMRGSMSNRTVDRRYGSSKVRVTRDNSSSPPSKLPRHWQTRPGPYHGG